MVHLHLLRLDFPATVHTPVFPMPVRRVHADELFPIMSGPVVTCLHFSAFLEIVLLSLWLFITLSRKTSAELCSSGDISDGFAFWLTDIYESCVLSNNSAFSCGKILLFVSYGPIALPSG